MNYLKTTILLAGMTALFGFVGSLFADTEAALIALAIAGLLNLVIFYRADVIALHAHNARPVDQNLEPDLYALVRDLALAAGIPTPRLYLTDCDQPNAFAAGRNPEHAALVISQGLRDRLTPNELAGVIAHELAHIRARDSLTMTVSATLVGAILALGGFGVLAGLAARKSGGLFVIFLAIVAALAAAVLQMTISRTREYAADKAAAEICGHPEWLASALRSIDNWGPVENQRAMLHPATAPLFIVDPIERFGLVRLLATHPSIERRITRLEGRQGG